MPARVLYAAALPLLSAALLVAVATPSECATSDSPRVQALRRQNSGFQMARHGQLTEAIAEYDAGIALDPSVSSLYYSRGLAYFELREYETALADFNKAIELESDEPQYYYQRAVVYDVLGSPDLARTDLQTVLSMTSDPDFVYPAQNLLARIIGGD